MLGHQNDAPASHTLDVIASELLEVTTPALLDRWLIRISVLLPLPPCGAARLAFTALLQQVGDKLGPVLGLPIQQR